MNGTDAAMHTADDKDSVPVSSTDEQVVTGEQVESEDKSATAM